MSERRKVRLLIEPYTPEEIFEKDGRLEADILVPDHSIVCTNEGCLDSDNEAKAIEDYIKHKLLGDTHLLAKLDYRLLARDREAGVSIYRAEALLSMGDVMQHLWPDLTTSPIDFDCELTEHHNNAAIQAHVLDDKSMREAGFYLTADGRWWHFGRGLGEEITFLCDIAVDGSDWRIDVIDEDFCQPYDYQRMLKDNPRAVFPLKILNKVEYWMECLAARGIISGHKKGAYI